MTHTINDNAAAFHLEKHTVVTDSQPTLRREAGQSLDIAFQVALEPFNFLQDAMDGLRGQ